MIYVTSGGLVCAEIERSLTMFLFCHVLAGILVGLALFSWRGDLRVIPLAVLGAVLPDLIDKPLGLLFLSYGRTFAHSLAFAVLLLALGAFLYWRTRSPLGIALAAGVLSHQVLDLMWMEPAAWFWPFSGQFPPPDPEPLLSNLLRDFTQPAEWIFAVASVSIGLVFAGRRVGTAAPVLSLAMAFFAMWILFCAITGSGCVLTGWDGRGGNLVAALVMFSGAAGVDRAGMVLGNPSSSAR